MRIRIRTKTLLAYLSILIVCLPYNTSFPEIVLTAERIASYFAFFYSALLFLKCRYWKQEQLYILYCWFSWALVSAFLTGTSIEYAISWVAPLLCGSICTLYLLKHDRENVIGTISWILTSLLIVQALSLVTHYFGTIYGHHKYVNTYFFGIRVQINKIIPFSTYFGLISYKYDKKRIPWSLIISTVCGLFFVLSEKVSTSIVGYAVILAVFAFSAILRSEHLWRNLGIALLIFAILFVLQYSMEATFSRWLLVEVLNEDITFTGRTSIWSQAFSYMNGLHWIVGNGIGHNYRFYLGVYWSARSAHNQYLDTVFCFGIIGLIIYIFMCVKQLKVNRIKRNDYWTRAFLAVFYAMIIMQIPATLYEQPFYYMFYVTSLYLPDMVDNQPQHE